ncbi:HlyD family type I secretion periplasmic adaptor subunit [Bradyrhizobium roseum]|uniref:HlyD family type I secretion periplasmic adaptor subunit n=1 Tax=Bradyrhizobium roseum TaxID=3056648 RepID=UPI002605F2CF|nr:HlyD family type I secretion periplasmic adaptor subunit [Bradyrhizobium roseus]WKA29100.1 HlyD family type I secretion periplasmic adaptor subunit [Bradyrhizobium roseus]
MTSTTTKGSPSETPDWLATPIEFEEQRGFVVSRNRMRLVLLIVLAALPWAALAPIRELSVARGQLIPVSQVRPVQHLEGGVVEQILVEEGQLVEQDQPLLRLQTVIADSELAGLKSRAQNLLLQKERVTALLAGRDFDLNGFGGVDAALLAEHLQVYRLRFDHRAREHQLQLVRMSQRKAEIDALERDIVAQKRLVGIQQQQFDMRQTLVHNGNVSKKQVLESEALLEQARGLVTTTEGRLSMTREALRETAAALDESDAQANRLWGEELSKISGELAEIEETIKKQTDRVERLIVRAPTRGRVQQVLQRSPGEVVRPGETIVRIVPQDDALVAEIFVKPDDIAAVKVNDKAELKVTAYDFSKYGKIKGEVKAVSPTTTENEEKRAFYKVLVRFDAKRSDRYAAEWQLKPGMTVDAEIISGSKSLLQYVLKPIYRGVDAAFAER